jgi:hypothetical protein
MFNELLLIYHDDLSILLSYIALSLLHESYSYLLSSLRIVLMFICLMQEQRHRMYHGLNIL